MYVCTHIASPDYIQKIKGVIFDCDGVLVDSMDANRMFYNLIRERMGLLSMTPEEEEYVHAHAVEQSLARIIPPERLEEADEIRAELDYRDILPYVRLEPGLVPFLDMLKTRGVLMAVNTNRSTTMDLLLEVFDLRHYFFPVMSAGRLSHAKPNPEGVFRILEVWGLAKNEVAYLGDSVLDERTARAAGVRFWAYKNHALLASMYVDDFESLQMCLQNTLDRKSVV